MNLSEPDTISAAAAAVHGVRGGRVDVLLNVAGVLGNGKVSGGPHLPVQQTAGFSGLVAKFRSRNECAAFSGPRRPSPGPSAPCERSIQRGYGIRLMSTCSGMCS